MTELENILLGVTGPSGVGCVNKKPSPDLSDSGSRAEENPFLLILGQAMIPRPDANATMQLPNSDKQAGDAGLSEKDQSLLGSINKDTPSSANQETIFSNANEINGNKPEQNIVENTISDADAKADQPDENIDAAESPNKEAADVNIKPSQAHDRNMAPDAEIFEAIAEAADAAADKTMPPAEVKNISMNPAAQQPIPAQQPDTQPAARPAVNNENAVGPAGGIRAPEDFEHALHIIRDGNRLAVSLDPEGFGKLDINLSLENGMLHAHVQVSDDSARNLIGNNIQQIIEALAKEGLSVADFSVSLRDGGGDGTAEDAYRGADISPEEPDGNPEETNLKGIVNIFV